MIVDDLRQACRRLLEEGKVKVVIGYGQSEADKPAYPIFVTKPEDVDKLVWNDQCFANLAVHLTRKEVKALGTPAIIVKGCDERALVVLEQESQFNRSDIYVIGVACDGVGNPKVAKCLKCSVHTPRLADEVVGKATAADVTEGRFAALEKFLKEYPPAQRIEFWAREFDRCVKCYACRQVCPMCYCERCIVDKNRPTVLDTSATLKGNFAWQILRAFHQAGRCVGCGECARVCPVGIDLTLLNDSLARAAENNFDEYSAGMDREKSPVIGCYSLEDKEGFIR